MKKKVSPLMILIGVVLLCIVALVAVRFIYGNRINHYKQVLIPAKGQIVCWEGSFEPVIPLYFYDEEKLSEMASAENFKQISFLTESGETIQAISWEVSEITENVAYSMKKLLLKVPAITQDTKLAKVSIQYVDTTEEFEIGDLNLVVIEPTVILNEWISTGALDLTPQVYERNIPFVVPRPTFIELSYWISQEDFVLHKIDLGIEGFQVDMSSLRLLKGDSMMDLERYSHTALFGSYRDYDLAETTGEITLKHREPDETSSPHIIGSICSKPVSEDEICCYYVNPIFHLTDMEGKSWEYATVGQSSYQIMLPDAYGNAGINRINEYVEKNGL